MRKHINQKAKKSPLRVPLHTIEKIVCDYYKVSTDVVRSCSFFARDRIVKGCVYAMAKIFMKRSYRIMEDEYHTSASTTIELTNYAKNKVPSDLEEIKKIIYESQKSRR